VSILDVPFGAVPPNTNSLNYTLFGAGGAVLASQMELPSSLALLSYTSDSWGGVLATDAGFWGFFAPVLGVGVGYASYGRERSSRALEPVVALPTTRLGIFVRRYAAACVPLAFGTGVVVLIEFEVRGPLATGLALALLLAIWGSLLLEAAAFLGLSFVLAHLLRSAGAVAAIGVALAAFLAFLIVPVEILIGDVQGVPPSLWTLQQAQMVNPTNLPNATLSAYFAGFGSPGILPSGAVAGATQLGLALGVTALVLVVTPIVGAMLAVGRE
jgi:ABC-type transport system involved in multi-copper enzyme maturation permease subunit